MGWEGPEAPQAQCFPSYPPTTGVGWGGGVLLIHFHPIPILLCCSHPITPFILMLGYLLPTILPGELGICPRG